MKSRSPTGDGRGPTTVRPLRPGQENRPGGARPIGFFVHHQGHGHARRCVAILEHLAPRPVRVFCARPELIETEREDCVVTRLPDPHSKPARTQALHDQPPCSALDCAPVGVEEIRQGMGMMARWMADSDPALMVSDVSAEVTLLARLCSVPSVKIRMHGERDDPAHMAAYTASAGLLAPFDESLEQPEFPARLRARTLYAGGLVAEQAPQDRGAARSALGLPADQQIIVVVAGSGGVGIPYASVSLGARAVPEALWVVVGNVARFGHETEFASIRCVGWVDNVGAYLAAADVVVGTTGDTLSHEIAGSGRPYVSIPEWCYYDEQRRKSEMLHSIGAAVHSATWPASFKAWSQVIAEAEAQDPAVRRGLVDGHAARRAARFLDDLMDRLWAEEPREEPSMPKALP